MTTHALSLAKRLFLADHSLAMINEILEKNLHTYFKSIIFAVFK